MSLYCGKDTAWKVSALRLIGRESSLRRRRSWSDLPVSSESSPHRDTQLAFENTPPS